MRVALLWPVLVVILAGNMASAAPSLGNGDCWRQGTPFWCRGSYNGGSTLYFYAINHFSDNRPNWVSSFTTSNSRWNNAAGPQVFSTSRHTVDTWVYYEDSSSGNN